MLLQLHSLEGDSDPTESINCAFDILISSTNMSKILLHSGSSVQYNFNHLSAQQIQIIKS